MAFDGIVIANIVKELKIALLDGRIQKIAQPEEDELLITIKNSRIIHRLLISAGASLPLIYLTSENKTSPMTAPNFCMLLRKHIQGGKIAKIEQPGLERIIRIEIEHLNELGDLCTKYLIVEIMGKHSNIIFCKEDFTILDSIKHISAQVSSIREVLPGRPYFVAETQKKEDPFCVTEEQFFQTVFQKPEPACKAIYGSLTGISPVMAQEICYLSSIDADFPANALSESEQTHLHHVFMRLVDDIRNGDFTPNIVYQEEIPIDFSSVPLQHLEGMHCVKYTSISDVLEQYYKTKNSITRIRQKSSDLRRIVQNALDRSRKKYELQLRQIQDTDKRDKYKVYGELIHTYGYTLPENSKALEALNYYTNEMIIIPLDSTMTPQENAKKYFDRYNKLKRTYENLSSLIHDTEAEIEHLESIQTSLSIALAEEDLVQLKEELTDYGYIRRKFTGKKIKITSKPFHYISADGYHMYVGKNNFQNDDLTFKFAAGNDWWFHAKGIPGSHVIVKSNGNSLPDRTFEEAAKLAAYFSKNRESEKVEIDYTEKKNVKKSNGGMPGFVIYHTNYSMLIEPDIKEIEAVSS